MKRVFIIASLCVATMLTSCLENSYQNNHNSNTTTTTTDDGKGGNGGSSDNKPAPTNEPENSFRSNIGKFSINFANKPQGPIRTEETNKAGMVETFQYIDQISDAGMYVAMYKDYPVGVITASNTDAKLKLEAENFMKNFGSKVDKTVEERLNGNKGISFSGSLNDSIKINMKSFFVGKRYYQFGTIATQATISDKESKKFINSFALEN
ncbi:MAG: hypothetical protein MJZ61_05530 [Bacteroidales bacterium]|nr:hypothetical protein [Bacteroidales bacterium]